MTSYIPSTVFTKTITATADTPFQVETEETIWLKSANIHCTTNDGYYGNAYIQASPIRANAVVWFDTPFKVSDLWFKNYTAGSNCVITITGIISKG